MTLSLGDFDAVQGLDALERLELKRCGSGAWALAESLFDAGSGASSGQFPQLTRAGVFVSQVNPAINPTNHMSTLLVCLDPVVEAKKAKAFLEVKAKTAVGEAEVSSGGEASESCDVPMEEASDSKDHGGTEHGRNSD